MTVAAPPTTERMLLRGITWATYEALLADMENRLRLTYDRGELEIMTPSREHECFKKLAGRLVEAMTEVLGIPINSGGSTTLRSALLAKGLEPDECYYVANEAKIRHKRKLDLAIDPPPDLAIEVEVTRSALDRLSIYAALGVGEVWRVVDGLVVFHVLADGSYGEQAASRSFPFLLAADVTRFLAESDGVDETAWIRGFRVWVRDDLSRRVGR